MVGSGYIKSVVRSSDNHAYFVVESGSGDSGSFVDYQRTGDGRLWHTGLRSLDNLEFRLNNQSTVMSLTQSQRVGIGARNPDEKLTVKGKIHSEEVIVDLSVPGPDYVFEEDYDLTFLKELEAYISKNGHLSGIPSAKEMEANGVTLGEMNVLLLKKIEELTLHTIKHEKAKEKLETTINNQQKIINELIERMEQLEN